MDPNLEPGTLPQYSMNVQTKLAENRKGLQFLASYTWSKTLVTDAANVDANFAGLRSHRKSICPGSPVWRGKIQPASVTSVARRMIQFALKLNF